MKVIVINGVSGAGKDTFVDFCRIYCPTNYIVYNLSTAAPAKKLYEFLGWDGKKTDKARKDLARLKYLLDSRDINIEYIKKEVETIQYTHALVFIHCREPEQIQDLVDEFDAITILIEKDTTPKYGDEKVLHYGYDFSVDNNGSCKDLANHAFNFMYEYLFRGEEL